MTTGRLYADLFADLDPLPDCFNDVAGHYIRMVYQRRDQPLIWVCRCGRAWEITEVTNGGQKR